MVVNKIARQNVCAPKFKRRPVVLQQGALLYSWTTDYFLSRQFADLSADRRSKHTLLLLDVPIGNSQSDTRTGWARRENTRVPSVEILRLSACYTTISKGVSIATMLPFLFAISNFLFKKKLWFWNVTNYENNWIIYNNAQVLRVNNKALEGTSFSALLVNNKLVQTRIKQCQQKTGNDEKEFIHSGLFIPGVLGRKRRFSTPLQVCLIVSFFKVLSCKT